MFCILHNLPNEFKELTISAWVKPDYSNGSPEFTVVSKDNAFVLSINKLVSPEKVTKFSIFDGMKWHSVESIITNTRKLDTSSSNIW